VIRETVLTATLAGFVAAVIFTVLQAVWITPLILQGETYEDAVEASAHVETVPQGESTSQRREEEPAALGHHHDEDEWKPQNGWQRTLFTFGANLLMGVGYAFVLVALYLLWRGPKNSVESIVYGLAGFLVFFAAPGLGLPPELPGTAAADLAARQQWWAMTAIATAGGLILFASQSRWWLRLLAVAIIIAPHFVPAPQPAIESSLAPEDLQTRFRWATGFCNAIFWLALGVTSGAMFQKWVAGGRESASTA
jgi:cobalt transporter subunit CbtA